MPKAVTDFPLAAQARAALMEVVTAIQARGLGISDAVSSIGKQLSHAMASIQPGAAEARALPPVAATQERDTNAIG